MVKPMRNKAVMFTVSAILIMALVLFATSIIIDSKNKENDALGYNFAFSQVYDLYDSLEKSVRDIVLASSGIVYSVSADQATFSESLPYSSSFLARLAALKNFAESKSDIALDVSEISNDPIMKIVPQNIFYKHGNYGEDVLISFDNISVVTNLFFDINIDKNATCIWDTVPGDFSLRVKVDGTGLSCDDTNSIGSGTSVSVNDGEIMITYNETLLVTRSIDADITTTIDYTDLGYSELWYPSDVITINSPIYRKGGIEIS